MEKTIEQEKLELKQAYNWALKVQKACFLKQIDITVKLGYCVANRSERNLHAWTVTVQIWDSAMEEHTTAEYRPWYGWDVFESEKKAIEAYLRGKGVKINNK